MSLPSFAYPGLTLGSTSAYTSGAGTHIHNEQITASLPGIPISSPSAGAGSKLSLSITPRSCSLPQAQGGKIPSRQISAHNILPSVNAVVLARITRLSAKQANVVILVVDEQCCADEFAGVIRREDVRGWEVDGVRIENAFRVGDVVRGVVISLGDQSSYYLSTARNELGVLLAVSENGNQMYPISWQHFRDPVTGKDEVRKVAKPV